jgi:hypothetical protein
MQSQLAVGIGPQLELQFVLFGKGLVLGPRVKAGAHNLNAKGGEVVV